MKVLCLLMLALFAFGASAAEEGAAVTPGLIRPLLIGAHAPDASLTDSEGQPTSLHQLKNEKPTVLIFYRGSW